MEASNLSQAILFMVKEENQENKELVAQAHKYWKEIKTDKEKIKEFLKLRPGEKPFVR